MYRILVIEDEQGIRNMVQEYLEKQFYEVCVYEDGESGLKAVQENKPDLVLLDVMLPKRNGFEVCKEIRKMDIYVPVIMLTARNQKSDIIVGLEVGADDYMVKPFSLEEMEARIKAVLRRNAAQSANSANNENQQGQGNAATTGSRQTEEQISRPPFLLDVAKHELFKNQQPIRLTPTEFQIFLLMFKNPGRVYTRLQLLDMALGEEYQGYERSIDTHVRNLRQKVEDNAAEPVHIVTVHGIGYKFNEN